MAHITAPYGYFLSTARNGRFDLGAVALRLNAGIRHVRTGVDSRATLAGSAVRAACARSTTRPSLSALNIAGPQFGDDTRTVGSLGNPYLATTPATARSISPANIPGRDVRSWRACATSSDTVRRAPGHVIDDSYTVARRFEGYRAQYPGIALSVIAPRTGQVMAYDLIYKSLAPRDLDIDVFAPGAAGPGPRAWRRLAVG